MAARSPDGPPAAMRARIADLISDDDPEDVRFVERLIASFLHRSPAMVGQLAAAVSARDVGSAAHWAHALKGPAGNVGADVVAELCAQLEHHAEAGRFELVPDHPVRVEAALAVARRHLAEVLDGLADH